MRKIPSGYGRGCIGDRTGAMRTSENSILAKFGEFPF
jgi:hypothetical protein